MPRGYGGHGRPMRLALCLCLALSVLILASLFGPRLNSYYEFWKQDIPTDLWTHLFQRHAHGWQLDSWCWTAGPGPRQKSYLLFFRRPFEQFADGLCLAEFRWPTSRGWGTWSDGENPWGLPWSEPRWVDLTADGRPELVLRFHQGAGGFPCDELRIFQVRRDRLFPLDIPLSQCQAVSEIKDLDADSRPELIVRGSELELFGKRCHAAGIAYTRVYRWVRESGEFRDRSYEFPGYYQDELRRALEFAQDQYNGGRESGERPRDRVLHDARVLAVTAIYHWCLGRADVGWKEYDEKLAGLLAMLTDHTATSPSADPDPMGLLAQRKQLSQLFFGREPPSLAASAFPSATGQRDQSTKLR